MIRGGGGIDGRVQCGFGLGLLEFGKGRGVDGGFLVVVSFMRAWCLFRVGESRAMAVASLGMYMSGAVAGVEVGVGGFDWGV